MIEKHFERFIDIMLADHTAKKQEFSVLITNDPFKVKGLEGELTITDTVCVANTIYVIFANGLLTNGEEVFVCEVRYLPNEKDKPIGLRTPENTAYIQSSARYLTYCVRKNLFHAGFRGGFEDFEKNWCKERKIIWLR